MPFNPDLRQHKIETAGYRVDGDYSHAIPAHPEYDSATNFDAAFYQERRDENDRLIGIPVAPIEYPGAPPPPPPVEIPDPGLKFTIIPYGGGGGTLGLSNVRYFYRYRWKRLRWEYYYTPSFNSNQFL